MLAKVKRSFAAAVVLVIVIVFVIVIVTTFLSVNAIKL